MLKITPDCILKTCQVDIIAIFYEQTKTQMSWKVQTVSHTVGIVKISTVSHVPTGQEEWKLRKGHVPWW